MPQRPGESDQSDLHHGTRRQRRSRPCCSRLEKLQASHARRDFEFEFDVAAIVQEHADCAAPHTEPHESLNDPHSGSSCREQVPELGHDGKRENDQRKILRPVLEVTQQKELGLRAHQAERKRTEQESPKEFERGESAGERVRGVLALSSLPFGEVGHLESNVFTTRANTLDSNIPHR